MPKKARYKREGVTEREGATSKAACSPLKGWEKWGSIGIATARQVQLRCFSSSQLLARSRHRGVATPRPPLASEFICIHEYISPNQLSFSEVAVANAPPHGRVWGWLTVFRWQKIHTLMKATPTTPPVIHRFVIKLFLRWISLLFYELSWNSSRDIATHRELSEFQER